MKGITVGHVVCFLLCWMCVTSRRDDGCYPEAECIPRQYCYAGTMKPKDSYICDHKSRHNHVCCLRDDGYGDMDYYDDHYEEYHGHPYRLSKFAKEVLRKYRVRKECGVRNESPRDMARVSTGFIADRGLTSFGEFPWHVALLVRERTRGYFGIRRSFYRYRCGATLIHPVLLMTAAHCVKGIRKYKLTAHLGEWNLYSNSGELFPAVRRRISRVFIHSGYKPGNFLNDIALLQMDRPVDTSKTPHIAPVCLPKSTYKFKDDQKCYLVGWGDDIYKPIVGSNILKSVSVTLEAEEEECADRLYASIPNLSDEFTLDPDSQRCITGGYGRDACTGDGGGAVVCPLSNEEGPDACEEHDCEDEHYFVVGVVSFGSPVCGEDSATVITDVPEKMDWIYTIINPAGGLKKYDYHFYLKGQGTHRPHQVRTGNNTQRTDQLATNEI